MQLGRYNNFKARTFESSICVFARKLKRKNSLKQYNPAAYKTKLVLN